MARTIQSPGVEIREIDQSLITNTNQGTNIFVAGYAPQGPTDEIIQVTSVDELQRIYGVPSNAAERYFYYSAKTVLDQSNANLSVARLPYDSSVDDTTQYYNALFYGVGMDLRSEVVDITTVSFSAVNLSSTRITIIESPASLGIVAGSVIVGPSIPENAVVTSVYESPNQCIVDKVIGQYSPPGAPTKVYKGNLYITLSADYSSAQSGFVITKPIHEPVPKEIYNEYKNGTKIWRSIPYESSNLKDSIVIFNKNKDVIEPNFSGYYISIADNSVVSPASTEIFDAASTIYVSNETIPTINYELSGGQVLSGVTVNGWVELDKVSFDGDVSSGSYDFLLTSPVSAASSSDSVSEVIANAPTFNISTNEFKDTIIISVFKLRPSLFGQDPNKLDYILVESYVGSLDANRKINNVNGGAPVNFFIEDIINSNSNTIELYVNPYLSGKSDDSLKSVLWTNGISGSNEPTKYIRVLSEKSLNDLTYTSEESSESDIYVLSEGYLEDWVVGATELIAIDPLDPELSNIRVGMTIQSLYFDPNTTITNINNGVYKVSIPAISASEATYGIYFYTIGLPKSSLFTNYTQLVKLYNNYLYNIGNYQSKILPSKYIGSVPTKLERILRKLENKDIYQIDVVADAGLSTIFAAQELGQGTSFSAIFDDIYYNDALDANLYDESGDTSGNTVIANWKTVTDVFINFSEKSRKDCFFVSDALRYIFVQGNTPTLKDEDKTFSQHITRALKNIYGPVNTSYAATYANWGKTYDGVKGKYFWQPMSGHIAALLGRIDQNQFPWSAPMGFNRAVLSGITELAISPNQKERDQLYRININPIVNFPNDGLVVFGQKTLQKKPSAFDRINVRRLFLWLEKRTEEVAKYYIAEPNTVYTRTRFKNTLTPIFDLAKNNEGVYDYMIKCDTSNNTPDTIDQNELHALIYIKPVRTAEFIVIDFIATKTGATFGENA